jgi:hypothetical protein
VGREVIGPVGLKPWGPWFATARRGRSGAGRCRPYWERPGAPHRGSGAFSAPAPCSPIRMEGSRPACLRTGQTLPRVSRAHRLMHHFLDEAGEGACLVVVVRPAGNTAQRSIGGNSQSRSTALTTPFAISGANIHSEAMAMPALARSATRTPSKVTAADTRSLPVRLGAPPSAHASTSMSRAAARRGLDLEGHPHVAGSVVAPPETSCPTERTSTIMG